MTLRLGLRMKLKDAIIFSNLKHGYGQYGASAFMNETYKAYKTLKSDSAPVKK